MKATKLEPLVLWKEFNEAERARREIDYKQCIEERKRLLERAKKMLENKMCHGGMNSLMNRKYSSKSTNK